MSARIAVAAASVALSGCVAVPQYPPQVQYRAPDPAYWAALEAVRNSGPRYLTNDGPVHQQTAPVTNPVQSKPVSPIISEAQAAEPTTQAAKPASVTTFQPIPNIPTSPEPLVPVDECWGYWRPCHFTY